MVILPKNKVEDFVVLGVPRFTRLKRLKNSARNSNWLSLNGMGKLLKVEKSTVARPGPRSVFRPSVPKVAGAFSLNAAVLNQRTSQSR